MESANKKMKVEIWSDVMCAFCYMGKKKFEEALSTFKHSSNIEIIWKSFQLAPGLRSEPGKNYYLSLSENSGMSIKESKAACDQLTNTAREAGLTYNFDKAVPVNTLNAHRLSHFAKHHGLQNQAEEALFKSYFTDGRNIDDYSTLVQLGTSVGLDETETKNMLESDQYFDEVSNDIQDAHQKSIRSVPFYVFNGKHSISGVQHSQIFSQSLELAYSEWMAENSQKTSQVIQGQACELNGVCK